MNQKVGVAVLGSTGSIGIQALEVISHYAERFRVTALTTNSNLELLQRQAAEFSPDLVALGDESAAAPAGLESTGATVRTGIDGLVEAAAMPEADIVLNGLSGAIGLRPSLAALENGHRLALANKESLVMAGRLIMAAAGRRGAEIIPVDSEHNAIFQCLGGRRTAGSEVKKVWLTASGGPFRDWMPQDIEKATPGQALNHPTWDMGEKITVDSATMMNKGLEVIEAFWLFDLPAEKIEVIIHPQSIVHSMVEFVDGAVMAQLSRPDMKLPIQAALLHPDRPPHTFTPTELGAIDRLTFSRPDAARFPSLGLAYRALEMGGTSPAVLNAANEVAVAAFLAEEITFGQIAGLIETTLECHRPEPQPNLEDILAADSWARETAREIIAGDRTTQIKRKEIVS
jgi:1-deoxy-D-xylulose-5-phosphate reductoisomerase